MKSIVSTFFIAIVLSFFLLFGFFKDRVLIKSIEKSKNNWVTNELELQLEISDYSGAKWRVGQHSCRYKKFNFRKKNPNSTISENENSVRPPYQFRRIGSAYGKMKKTPMKERERFYGNRYGDVENCFEKLGVGKRARMLTVMRNEPNHWYVDAGHFLMLLNTSQNTIEIISSE